MKKYRDGATTQWHTLLVMGSLAAAMQVSVAQTSPSTVKKNVLVQAQPLAVNKDAAIQEALSPRFSSLSPKKVQAPPRPLGSDKVVIGVGLNPPELKRQKMAHSASKIVKKDPTRDDSLDVIIVSPLPQKKK